MIDRITWGQRVAGLVYYLYGPGRANEHVDPRIVAGWRNPDELEPVFLPDGSRDFRILLGLLNQPLAALQTRGFSRPVWHCSVRTAPEDRFLTDAEWQRIAATVMDRTGLAPADDPDGVRWVAIRHGADHIHLVATMARQDGRLPRTNQIYAQTRQACLAIEAELGLRATASMDRTAAGRPTRAETEKATRAGQGETPRERLRRIVVTTAAESGTEAAFFASLRRAGVLVHLRSRPGSASATGYAVALDSDRNRFGDPIWFSGGRLAADLTLPKLRHRWSTTGGTGGDGPVPGVALSAPSARAVLIRTAESAARNARNEAEYFLRLNEAGIRVRRRFSDRNPTQVTGYALHISGHLDQHGEPAWFSAAKLNPRLSLTTLRRTWGTTPEPGALTFEERDAIWNDAARVAAHAATQLRTLPPGHPYAHDIAWATSDLLHAAAARLGDNRQLRRAADAYDRAARPRYARLPRRSRDGDHLRGAARMLGLLGHVTRDRTLASVAALAHLAALAAAVAELRDRQRHAAQRTAARTAAQHLNSARTFAAFGMPTASAGPTPREFPDRPPVSDPHPSERPTTRPTQFPDPPRRRGHHPPR